MEGDVGGVYARCYCGVPGAGSRASARVRVHALTLTPSCLATGSLSQSMQCRGAAVGNEGGRGLGTVHRGRPRQAACPIRIIGRCDSASDVGGWGARAPCLTCPSRPVILVWVHPRCCCSFPTRGHATACCRHAAAREQQQQRHEVSAYSASADGTRDQLPGCLSFDASSADSR